MRSTRSGNPTSATMPLTSPARLERGPDRVEKVAAQEQVLGRVPREAELGQEDELGAGIARTPDRLRDQLRVAVDVTDGGIDLGEGEPEMNGFGHTPKYGRAPR